MKATTSVPVAIGLIGVLVLSGCGSQQEEEPELKPRISGEVSEPALQIMLHNKQVHAGGRSVTLSRKRIAEVEFHEVNPTSDGSYTATLSFSQNKLRIKAKVTYRIQKTRSPSGIVVENYPVSKVVGLSIKRSKD